jgi:Mg2+ and Co2+ transporter CorA
MKISCYQIDDDLEPAAADEHLQQWLSDQDHVWVDLESNDVEEIESSLIDLQVPDHILGRLREQQFDGRLALIDDLLFLELSVQKSWTDQLPAKLSVLCRQNSLLTIHGDALTEFAETIRGATPTDDRIATASDLLCSIIERAVTQSGLVAVTGQEGLRRLIRVLDEQPTELKLQSVFDVARRVDNLAQMYEAHSACLESLQTIDTPAFDRQATQTRIASITNQLEQLARAIGKLELSVRELHHAYLVGLHDRTPSEKVKHHVIKAIMRSPPFKHVVKNVLPSIRFSTRYGIINGVQYHEAYERLRPGDIIFHKDTTKLNSLIVPGEFSHTALCIGKDGRRELAEMVAVGYHETTFFDELRAATRIGIGRCSDWDSEYTKKVIQRCRSFSGINYDSLFELGIEALYCSELVYQADFERRLEVSLDDLLGMGQQYISPDGLWNAPNLEVVWDSASQNP